MRFFTTLKKAGRLEFFFVSVAINIAYWAMVVYVLELDLGGLTDFSDPELTAETISYNAGNIPLFILGLLILVFLGIINVCRRLKDLRMGYGWALLSLVPVVGTLFSLWLLFSAGISEKTYTPYGDNPYDPNSWVPPDAPNSGSAVSYRGHDLFLPGEETDQAA